MILTASQHSKIVRKIYLDGKNVTTQCVLVDTDAGYVVMIASWPPKRVGPENKLETKIAHGKVEVEFVPEAQVLFDLGGKLEG